MNYVFVKFSLNVVFVNSCYCKYLSDNTKTVPGLYVKFMVYSVLSVYIMFCLWQCEC